MQLRRGVAWVADHAVGFAAAGILLAPFTTMGLPFRTALVSTAVLQLALTLAAVAATVRPAHARAALAAARRPILVGLALHLAATTLGTVVAIARANDPTFAAGQLLALGLVPLAAVTLAGAAVERWKSLAAGLAAGFSIGAVVQIVASQVLSGDFAQRFMLPNAVSLSGAAVVVLALAACLARANRLALRLLGWTAGLLALALVVVTQTRTHYIGLVVAGVTFAAISLARGPHPLVRAGIGAGGALLLALSLTAAAWAWWRAERPPLRVETAPGAPVAGAHTRAARLDPSFDRLATVLTPASSLIRVAGHISCAARPELTLRLRGLEAGPRDPAALWFGPVLAPETVLPFLLLAPGDGGLLALDASRIDGAPCRLLDATAERLGPAVLGPVVTRVWTALSRPPDPDPAGVSGALAADASLAFRQREALAVLGEIRAGSVAALVLGRGLGATFRLDTVGFDNRGSVVPFGETNFIHNAYLFLVFKLGVVGTLLFLGALALWIGEAVRAAVALPPSSPERSFAAGAAAVWASMAVMALAAPHLVSAGSAPLLGFLLAATAHLPGVRLAFLRNRASTDPRNAITQA